MSYTGARADTRDGRTIGRRAGAGAAAGRGRRAGQARRSSTAARRWIAIIVHSLGGPDCRAGVALLPHGSRATRATWIADLQPSTDREHPLRDRSGRPGRGTACRKTVAATHATGWNQRSIGIELVNNGDGVRSVSAVRRLTRSCGLVHGHPAAASRHHAGARAAAFGRGPFHLPGRETWPGLHGLPPQARPGRRVPVGRRSWRGLPACPATRH